MLLDDKTCNVIFFFWLIPGSGTPSSSNPFIFLLFKKKHMRTPHKATQQKFKKDLKKSKFKFKGNKIFLKTEYTFFFLCVCIEFKKSFQTHTCTQTQLTYYDIPKNSVYFSYSKSRTNGRLPVRGGGNSSSLLSS